MLREGRMEIVDKVGKFILSGGNVKDCYDKFCSFLQKVKESGYDYKVAMGRRCFNLYTAIMKNDDGSYDLQTGVISETGIFLYTEEIAEYYLQYRRFPSILIFYDVLFDGRMISYTIDALKEAIWCLLLQRGCQIKSRELRSGLMDAIDVWVYAVCWDRGTFVVDRLFLYDKAEVKLNDTEAHQLLHNLGLFLLYSKEANTTFMLTLNNPELELCKRADWKEMAWACRRSVNSVRYQEKSHFLFLRERFVCFGHVLQGLNDRKRATGIVFLKDMDSAQVSSIWEHVLKRCPKYKGSKLYLALQSKHEFLLPYQMQMLSLIASAATLRDFFVGKSEDPEKWSTILDRTDLAKIASNFGRYEDTYPLVRWMLEDEQILDSILELDRRQDGSDERHIYAESEESQDELCAHWEREFSELYFTMLAQNYEYSHNFKKYSPSKRPESMAPLGQCLTKISEECQSSKCETLVSMIMLMRQGIASLLFCFDERSGSVRVMANAD